MGRYSIRIAIGTNATTTWTDPSPAATFSSNLNLLEGQYSEVHLRANGATSSRHQIQLGNYNGLTAFQSGNEFIIRGKPTAEAASTYFKLNSMWESRKSRKWRRDSYTRYHTTTYVYLTVGPPPPPPIGPPTFDFTPNPSKGAITAGDVIIFHGSASNYLGNPVDVYWTSNIQPSLSLVGNGAGTGSLIPGTHTITATITSDGYTVTHSFIVDATNTPPVLTVNWPANIYYNNLQTYTVTATANDVEDGDRTAFITWRVDNTPLVSTLGGSLSTTLDTGVRVVRATIQDTKGGTATDSRTYNVTHNDAPTIDDMTVLDNSGGLTTPTQSIVLAVAASDIQDGNLSTLVVWTSSIQGTLGTGQALNLLLQEGTHTITATVTDSAGAIGSRSTLFTVYPTPILFLDGIDSANSTAYWVVSGINTKNSQTISVSASVNSQYVIGAFFRVLLTLTDGTVVQTSTETIITGTGYVTMTKQFINVDDQRVYRVVMQLLNPARDAVLYEHSIEVTVNDRTEPTIAYLDIVLQKVKAKLFPPPSFFD